MPGKGKKGSGNRVKYKEGADEIIETYAKDDYNRKYDIHNYNNSHTYPDSWGSDWNRGAYYATNSNVYGSGTGGYGSNSSGYGSSSSGYGSSSSYPNSSYASSSSSYPNSSYASSSSSYPNSSYGSSSSSYPNSGPGLEYWQNLGKKGGSKKTRRKSNKRRKTNKRRK